MRNGTAGYPVLPRASGRVLLRLAWTEGTIDLATQHQQLTILIRNSDVTDIISLRVQTQRAIYLRVRGCPSCASTRVQKPPCFPGCHAQLVEHRMARHLLPGGSAHRVAYLTPRPVSAIMLCWPTAEARPFPPEVLAVGYGIRLVQRWRTAGQVLINLALETQEHADEIAAAIADQGWRTWIVKAPVGRGHWLRYVQPLLAWWPPLRTALPPTLLIPPLPGTLSAHTGRVTTRAYTRSSASMGLAPRSAPPTMLRLGQEIVPHDGAEASAGVATTTQETWWGALWSVWAQPASAPPAVDGSDETLDPSQTTPDSGTSPDAPSTTAATTAPDTPSEPPYPAMGTLLTSAEVSDVVVELIARFDNGVTKNGLKKLFVGAGAQADRRARMVYLWLHSAGLLSEPRDQNLPFREKRQLVVKEAAAIRDCLAATSIPTAEQLAAAAQLGSWGEL